MRAPRGNIKSKRVHSHGEGFMPKKDCMPWNRCHDVDKTSCRGKDFMPWRRYHAVEKVGMNGEPEKVLRKRLHVMEKVSCRGIGTTDGNDCQIHCQSPTE